MGRSRLAGQEMVIFQYNLYCLVHNINSHRYTNGEKTILKTLGHTLWIKAFAKGTKCKM